jgi:hypothetical protein
VSCGELSMILLLSTTSEDLSTMIDLVLGIPTTIGG